MGLSTGSEISAHPFRGVMVCCARGSLAFKNTFLDSDPVSVEQPLPYALAKACTKTAIAAHSNLPTRASRRVHALVP
jgi:hypothetical protein